MAVIYRYTDIEDETIKYVGIVWSNNRTLKQRVEEHSKNDEWIKERLWKIEYLKKDIKTRTDAEMLEAHYISKFGTNEYFNKAKKDWGKSDLIDDSNDEWETYSIDTIPISDFIKEFSAEKIGYGPGFLGIKTEKFIVWIPELRFLKTNIQLSHDANCFLLNRLCELFDINNDCFLLRFDEITGENIEKIIIKGLEIEQDENGALKYLSIEDFTRFIDLNFKDWVYEESDYEFINEPYDKQKLIDLGLLPKEE